MTLLQLLSQEPVTHEVNGAPQKFWPLSIAMSFKLRGLAKPVAKAVAALLTSSQSDVGKESVVVTSAGGDTQQRTSLQPISSDLARLRFDQRQVSIESLFEGIFNDASASVLASMVMDSMRETFETKMTPADFQAKVSAPIFMEMLGGVAKANAKLFDPLKKWATDLTAALRKGIEAEPTPANGQSETSASDPTTSSG